LRWGTFMDNALKTKVISISNKIFKIGSLLTFVAIVGVISVLFFSVLIKSHAPNPPDAIFWFFALGAVGAVLMAINTLVSTFFD
jgi:hypothetical protein